jgi:hypothetical protein
VWWDVDLAAGTIIIAHTMDIATGRREATKNREVRTLPIGPALVARLRRWRMARFTRRTTTPSSPAMSRGKRGVGCGPPPA